VTAKKTTKTLQSHAGQERDRLPADQKATVRALGLKRISHSVEQDDTPTVQGMMFKVKHLVEVEEL
jgi:large subunit ribosomal protein L30